jgi:hypothetical protein
MTLQTDSTPISGPRLRRALRLAGARLRCGDASVGPQDSAESLIARREAGRDHDCRQANEAVLPFSVLHKAVIVAAVWAIVRWRADPREVRVTRFLFGMKPTPRLTDLEGDTQMTTGSVWNASDREEGARSAASRGS